LGTVFSIDKTSGQRTLVSDGGINGSNPIIDLGFDIIENSSGNVFVIDRAAVTGNGALLLINTNNGNRTTISDFSDNAQGPLGEAPDGIAENSSGNILVSDGSAGTNQQGVIFVVDTDTGNRTILSDFGVGNPQGDTPRRLAIAPFPPGGDGPLVIIPTLSQWGMIFATIILGMFAVLRLRRKASE